MKKRKAEDYLKPVLTVTFENADNRVEVYMLQPGECFPRFGGSSQGLVVEKTASCITRTYNRASGVEDFERDIYDPSFWRWIAQLVNEGGELQVTAKALPIG